MRTDQLKHILSRQTIVVAVLPFVFLSIIAVTWYLPKFKNEIETHQIHLSQITASKAENHLIQSMTILKSVSNFIEASADSSNYQKILNSQINVLNSLKAIYVIGSDGKVLAVSLKSNNPGQAKDLKGLDLSQSPLVKMAKQQKKPVWSNTFLSVIGGGISVALAVPVKDKMIMGEIDLRELSYFLDQMATSKNQLLMVLDQKGQVIADQEGQVTAQQLNLNHLSIVKQGLKASQPVFNDFVFDGRSMSGVLIKARLIDWSILVASPKGMIYRPIWTTIGVLIMIFATTVFMGILLSIVLARRLSYRFEGLAKHTRQIAEGNTKGQWPVFNIKEFKALSNDIQNMADAIQEREAYNRILFADSAIPLLVLDSNTLKAVDGNQSVLRILGLQSPDQLRGKTISDFSAPEQKDKQNVSTAIQLHAKASIDKGFTSFEWVFQRSDRTTWYADISLSRFHYLGKQLLQMSIKDITKIKSETARREKLEEQLRQSQKMESIGTLAGGIAHDFNNILFPVMGFTEIVMEDLGKQSPSHFALEQILKGCLRAKDLVEQILTFSRQSDKENKPIQMKSIVKEILTLVRATLPTTIEIHPEINENTGLVMADPTKIHQIMMNLITNAFHAMESNGGTLTLALDEVQFSSDNMPSIHLIPGAYICLTISDTGTGIAPDIMENIFNPYFTTKVKGKGTGLGLSVVHGIIKNYNGEITVESKPGTGSTFKIYLPKIVSDSNTRTDQDNDLTPSGTGNILLVDDEKPICFMIEQMLERLGYQVTSRTSSPDAFEAFKACPDKFDLIITDMTMPSMTGDELAQEVKQIRPDIPILLCTGFSEKINQGKTSQIQVDHILMKPILKKDLALAIDKVLNYR